MYAYPVFLPTFSNREDLLLNIALFDDDTAAPINLAGITLATGMAFTGANWNVNTSVITTSTSTLTIPNYPVDAQLSVLTLTVPVGLAIVIGSPVTISDAAVSLNSMSGYVTGYDSTTGIMTCQIGMTYQFEIRRGAPHQNDFFATFSTLTDGVPLLTASLGSGILVTDLGFLQVLIPEAQFKKLSSSTYVASLTFTDSVNTRHAFIAQLPVLRGGVTN